MELGYHQELGFAYGYDHVLLRTVSQYQRPQSHIVTVMSATKTTHLCACLHVLDSVKSTSSSKIWAP